MRTLKESGIDWIGQIPSGWKICQIKQLYEVIHGMGDDMTSFSQEGTDLCLLGSGITWSGINMSKISKVTFSANSLRSESLLLKAKRQKLLKDGDILISGQGSTCGTTCVYNKSAPCYAYRSVYIARAKNDNNAKFLYYWMYAAFFSGYIKTISNRVTVKNINNKQIEQTPIVELSRKEQDDIIEFLNNKCSVIDTAIAKKERLKEQLEEYKKSLISRSVFQGIDEKVKMKDSDTDWIGYIPDHWKICKGKFIFTMRRSRGNDINLQMLSPTRNYGIVPQEKSDNNVVLKPAAHTDLTKRRTIHKNDFCLSLSSHTDGIFCSDYEGVISKEYKAFYISSEKAYNKYYRYMFVCDTFIKKLASYTSTFRDGKAIPYDDFADTELCLPPLEEQKEIVDFLDKKCAVLDKAIAKMKESIEKLDEYKKSLVYHAVTGKIDCKKKGIEE